MPKVNVVLLDNYDSFTYNLVDEIRSLGIDLTVFRNSVAIDTVMDALERNENSLLMLSPGPGTPSNAGCMMKLLDNVSGKFPVLGICLGHQAIVQHFGGTIDRAPQVMHGKSSQINHSQSDAFSNLPNPLPVARYHSLMATVVPDCLDVIAEVDTVPMAVMHQEKRMLGLQFHPESVLTSQGSQLLQQSINYLVEKK